MGYLPAPPHPPPAVATHQRCPSHAATCHTLTHTPRTPLPFPAPRPHHAHAPAHARAQNVINQFTQLARANPRRLYFLGNVRLGRDLSLAELQRHYNAVVLAYGAECDRPLGVPGEVRCCAAPGDALRAHKASRRPPRRRAV